MSLASKLKAGEARERIKANRQALTAAQREYSAGTAKARTYQDSDLHPAVLAEKRRELEAAAQAKLKAETQRIRTELAADTAVIRAFVEEDRPKPGADSAGLQSAWQRVERELAGGRSLPAIIATADEETLHAIREEGPSYLRAKSAASTTHGLADAIARTTGSDGTTEAVHRSVDRRLAEITTGLPQVAVQWEAELRATEAEIAPMLTHSTAVADGVDRGGLSGMAAAIESKLASQEATRELPEPIAEPASA